MHLSQQFFVIALLFITIFWFGIWVGSKEYKREVKWFQQMLYESTLNFYLKEKGWKFEQAEALASQEIESLVQKMHKELNGGV